ncbi:MAG: SDR family NAD(P)-dependent oxidoreductase [Janthinobacterium lividum]
MGERSKQNEQTGDGQKTLRLDGKVAFITAGANGIGAGAAQEIARYGGRVTIADVDAENGERLVETVRATGGDALFIKTDVLQTEQIDAAIQQTVRHFGRLDILINNAGGVRGNLFIEQPERSWRKHIDFNLISMLAATHAGARAMIAAGNGGTIVNIASSEGLRAAPQYAVYGACKAAMVSFTRSMALELSAHGIHVHALAPDMIETPGLNQVGAVTSAAMEAARARYIPLQRVGNVEEIAHLIVFLASDMASYLTGLTIPVDGGTLAASGWNRMPGNDQGWTLYHE